MLLKILRNGLGLIIVFANWLVKPKQVQRSAAEQELAQSAVVDHSLYQFHACPFCVKTRRALRRLNLDVELRDINKEPKHRIDLQDGGGRVKVPCLRIENNGQVEWMYESNDIIHYLEQRVA